MNALRILLFPAVVAVTAVGVWFFGGVVTDDFGAAMGLVAAWLVGAGVVAVLLSARFRLWLPVFGAYVLTAGAIVLYLGYSSLVGKTVNEQVAVAGVAGSVDLGRGTFFSIAHSTSGSASFVRLPSGQRVVTLRQFETDAGPDLRVYLVRTESNPDDARDLGALKGNRGTQQYEIPADVDVRRYATVLIWCRAFSVPFGAAAVRPV